MISAELLMYIMDLLAFALALLVFIGLFIAIGVLWVWLRMLGGKYRAAVRVSKKDGCAGSDCYSDRISS